MKSTVNGGQVSAKALRWVRAVAVGFFLRLARLVVAELLLKLDTRNLDGAISLGKQVFGHGNTAFREEVHEGVAKTTSRRVFPELFFDLAQMLDQPEIEVAFGTLTHAVKHAVFANER